MLFGTFHCNGRKMKALFACLLGGCALTLGAAAPAGVQALADGAHDFDFDLGLWKTQITRRVHPLTGSDETMRLSGTVTVRKVWDGRAQLEEIEADGPKGRRGVFGPSLCLRSAGAAMEHEFRQQLGGEVHDADDRQL